MNFHYSCVRFRVLLPSFESKQSVAGPTLVQRIVLNLIQPLYNLKPWERNHFSPFQPAKTSSSSFPSLLHCSHILTLQQLHVSLEDRSRRELRNHANFEVSPQNPASVQARFPIISLISHPHSLHVGISSTKRGFRLHTRNCSHCIADLASNQG